MVARAGVLLVDFEGRSDGRSLRLVINSVAPRHLIIVHGTRQVSKSGFGGKMLMLLDSVVGLILGPFS